MIELQNRAHACPLSQLTHHCLGNGPLSTDFFENRIKIRLLKKDIVLRSYRWDWKQMLRALQWRHNGSDGVPNHQSLDSLLSCLFRRRSKKTSKIRLNGLCEGNSPMTGEIPHKGPVTRKMFPFGVVYMAKGHFSYTATLSKLDEQNFCVLPWHFQN